MARTVLVAGTASHVGKSTVATGLCRLLADRGVDVAPFKAQNMSNNARVVPRLGPDGGPAWGEIGVSQYIQARAARIHPRVDLNPVLLKPTGEGTSQVVIHGMAEGHYGVSEYYKGRWVRAKAAVEASHERLATDHDVIIAEGAGSIAEPNLRDRDLANRETARIADAEVLLVADIERGGAFAAVVGSLELAPDDLRKRIVGVLFTKFRGDTSLLDTAINELENRTGVPVLGVLPHEDPGLPAEDSVDVPADQSVLKGTDDGVPNANSVTVAVPRLPRIANLADFDPLAAEPGVRVAFLPLDCDLDGADAIILPGTKNTLGDLAALRQSGMADAIITFNGPIVGLCGGYQLLGERLIDPGVESQSTDDWVAGFGLLPVETRFSEEKTVQRVSRKVRGVGPLAGFSGSISGYEIHLGDTHQTGRAQSFGEHGAATARVLGTYLHGLFENPDARAAFVRGIFAAAGREPPATVSERTDPAGAAADLLRTHSRLRPLGLPEN